MVPGRSGAEGNQEPDPSRHPRRAAAETFRSGIRRERVDAEVRRLTELRATEVRLLHEDGLDHNAVTMTDPEGNEFDGN